MDARSQPKSIEIISLKLPDDPAEPVIAIINLAAKLAVLPRSRQSVARSSLPNSTGWSLGFFNFRARDLNTLLGILLRVSDLQADQTK